MDGLISSPSPKPGWAPASLFLNNERQAMKTKQDDKLEHYEAAHCEAEMELALIADRLQDMPAASEMINWSHVGSMRYIVHMLREVRLHLDNVGGEA